MSGCVSVYLRTLFLVFWRVAVLAVSCVDGLRVGAVESLFSIFTLLVYVFSIFADILSLSSFSLLNLRIMRERPVPQFLSQF